MRLRHPMYIAVVFISLGMSSCSREFKSADYWPVESGAYWEYDSPIKRIEVSDASGSPGERVMTLSYMDSSGMILWRESIVTKQQGLFWQTMTTPTGTWPEIQFNPPLPITPQSDQPEALYTVYGHEKRGQDSLLIHVTFQIDGFETVETPAGSFTDCLKMSMNYNYNSTSMPPLLAGRSVFWFARGIGLVRFQLPSGQGSLTRYSLRTAV